jgi:hypothetical protein
MIRGRFGRQDGQVLPLMAFFMLVVAALMVLVIDVARVYIAQQQLQNAANAAALAAGLALPNSVNAYTQAVDYSGESGERNALFGYNVSAPSSGLTVTFECLSHGAGYAAATNGGTPTCQSDASGDACRPPGAALPVPSGVATCNSVVVTETATVKSIFSGLIFPSWTVSARAIAAARGGIPRPLNVFVILDTTGSMGQSCGETVTGISANETVKEDCAKAGAQALLESLYPCSGTSCTCTSSTTCTSGTPKASLSGANWTDPEDEVGMMMVPANASSFPAADETDCKSNSADGLSSSDTEYPPWNNPTSTAILNSDEFSGYQAIGLSTDYRNTDAANATLSGLSTGSDLVKSVYWSQCSPAQYPGGDYYGLKEVGGHGSYLAGAISTAEDELLNAPVRTPAAQNVIVIESDGEMTDPVKFSDGSQRSTSCLDAENAATAAKAQNITIYTIEYGSDSSDACGTDSPTDAYDNAATLMEDMATAPAAPYYYDDPGTGTGPTLAQDFAAVGQDITEPRLIADCTQAPPAC